MPNTKTFLVLITVASSVAIACILATHTADSNDKIADRHQGNWKAGTKDSFTGWLERLQQGIAKEMKKESA